MAGSRDKTGASESRGPVRFSSRLALRQLKANKEKGGNNDSCKEESDSDDEDYQGETSSDEQRNGSDSGSRDGTPSMAVGTNAKFIFQSLAKVSKGAVVKRLIAEADANRTHALNPHPYAAFDVKMDSNEARNFRKAPKTTFPSDYIRMSLGTNKDLDKPLVQTNQGAITKRFCQAMVDTDAANDGPVEDGDVFQASRQWEKFRAGSQDAREVEAYIWAVVEAAIDVHTKGPYLLEEDKGKKIARPKQGCELINFWNRISTIEELLRTWKVVWPDIVAGGVRLQTLVQMPHYAGRLKAANQQNNRVRQIGRRADEPRVWRHIKLQIDQDRTQAAIGQNSEKEDWDVNTEEGEPKPTGGSSQGRWLQSLKNPPSEGSAEHQSNSTDENEHDNTVLPSVGPRSESSTARITARYVDVDGKISTVIITKAKVQRLMALNRSDSSYGSIVDYLTGENGSSRIDGDDITHEALGAEIQKLLDEFEGSDPGPK